MLGRIGSVLDVQFFRRCVFLRTFLGAGLVRGVATLFGSGGCRLEVWFVRIENSHRRGIPENVFFV